MIEPKISDTTKEFLTKFYGFLRQDNWGDINPEYFNPNINEITNI